jgi:peptidyl-prolyl cis-trans isomerase SurA
MKLICTILAAAVVAGAAIPVNAQVMNNIVNGIEVVVHDSVVTTQDVLEYSEKAEYELRRDYRSQPSVLQQKMYEARRDSEEHLLERQLILHDFKVASLSIPEKYIQDEVNSQIRSHGDRMVLIKTLEAQGMTFDKFRMRLREQLIERLMRRQNASPEKIVISPHKIETYYQEHREAFKLEDRVKLRMIVLNKSGGGGDGEQPRKIAEEVLAKVNSGGNFSELAKQYSQGTQRSEGGLFGWGDRSALRKDLADAAFALKPGEHSGIIDASDAYYVMMVEDAQPAHFTPLAEVREQIEKDLTDSERSRLERQWIEKLKKKTFWRYF